MCPGPCGSVMVKDVGGAACVVGMHSRQRMRPKRRRRPSQPSSRSIWSALLRARFPPPVAPPALGRDWMAAMSLFSMPRNSILVACCSRSCSREVSNLWTRASRVERRSVGSVWARPWGGRPLTGPGGPGRDARRGRVGLPPLGPGGGSRVAVRYPVGVFHVVLGGARRL